MKVKVNGFSLVELSIVLVILGLLVGGILTGQNLIRASEMRAITTEFQQYQTAINIFKQKYFALPGDFAKATEFWDEDVNCPPSSGTPLTDTCKGNGDGIIAIHAGSAAQYTEAFLFWQHLAKAGLINGEFTGVPGPDNQWQNLHGENAPLSKLGGAGWSVETDGDHYDSWGNYHYDIDAQNVLNIGAIGSSEGAYDPILIPEEAWNIDTKMDDGKPGRGSVILVGWDTCSDANDSSETESDYQLDESSVACALYFRNGL